MNEKIEPALSAEDLERISHESDESVLAMPTPDDPAWKSEYRLRVRRGFEAQLIAFANASLPDSDPRKITRHTLWILRTLISDIDTQHPNGIEFRREAVRFADALESYLPPEK